MSPTRAGARRRFEVPVVWIIAFVVLAFAGILMAGTSGRAANLRAVQLAYPKARLVTIPGKSSQFIVEQPSGEIIYVETLGWGAPAITLAYSALSPDRP